MDAYYELEPIRAAVRLVTYARWEAHAAATPPRQKTAVLLVWSDFPKRARQRARRRWLPRAPRRAARGRRQLYDRWERATSGWPLTCLRAEMLRRAMRKPSVQLFRRYRAVTLLNFRRHDDRHPMLPTSRLQQARGATVRPSRALRAAARAFVASRLGARYGEHGRGAAPPPITRPMRSTSERCDPEVRRWQRRQQRPRRQLRGTRSCRAARWPPGRRRTPAHESRARVVRHVVIVRAPLDHPPQRRRDVANLRGHVAQVGLKVGEPLRASSALWMSGARKHPGARGRKITYLSAAKGRVAHVDHDEVACLRAAPRWLRSLITRAPSGGSTACTATDFS